MNDIEIRMFENFKYLNEFYLYYIDLMIIHYRRHVLIDVYNRTTYREYYDSYEYKYYMNLIKTYAKYINK